MDGWVGVNSGGRFLMECATPTPEPSSFQRGGFEAAGGGLNLWLLPGIALQTLSNINCS